MKVLSKLLAVLILGSLLYACSTTGPSPGPTFSIIKTGDKYTDEKLPGYLAENNRLSKKSTQGGVHVEFTGGEHIDYKGVFIDPYLYKDKITDKIISLGFYVMHCNYGPDDGFEPIQSIIFFTDSGERFEALAKPIDSDLNIRRWDENYKNHCRSYREFRYIEMQFNDFEKLALAMWVEVEINGGQRSLKYDRDEIYTSFTTNINTFYKYFMKK